MFFILLVLDSTACRDDTTGRQLTQLRLKGFEPAMSGLGNRCSENAGVETANTSTIGKTEWSPQLTPKSPKRGAIDTENVAADLAEITAVLPELPEHIKAAVKALVTTAMDTGKDNRDGAG